eukprot:Pompholyxophrys_punicea_v1_NODE_133_length_3286_cov_14.739709.p2 type:complete len:179 gc:universal NODE_133_length_3286_cov_14.739709:1641-2177(+)
MVEPGDPSQTVTVGEERRSQIQNPVAIPRGLGIFSFLSVGNFAMESSTGNDNLKRKKKTNQKYEGGITKEELIEIEDVQLDSLRLKVEVIATGEVIWTYYHEVVIPDDDGIMVPIPANNLARLTLINRTKDEMKTKIIHVKATPDAPWTPAYILEVIFDLENEDSSLKAGKSNSVDKV